MRSGSDSDGHQKSSDQSHHPEQQALDNQLYSLVVNYDDAYREQFFTSIEALVKEGANLEMKDDTGKSLVEVTDIEDLQIFLKQLMSEIKEANDIRLQHIQEGIYNQESDTADSKNTGTAKRDPIYEAIDNVYKAIDEAPAKKEAEALMKRLKVLREYLPTDINDKTAGIIHNALEELEKNDIPANMMRDIQLKYKDIINAYLEHLTKKLKLTSEQLETAKATLSDPDNTSAASYFYRLTHPASTARISAIGRFSTINTENNNMQQVERHLKPMFEKILQSPDLQSKVSGETFLIFQSLNYALHNSPGPDTKENLYDYLSDLKSKITGIMTRAANDNERDALRGMLKVIDCIMGKKSVQDAIGELDVKMQALIQPSQLPKIK